MEIKYYGANCLRLADKKVSITINDEFKKHGLKGVTKSNDICIFTDTGNNECAGRFIIHGPGEYEISGVSVKGIAAKSMINKDDTSVVIYRIEYNGSILGVIGNIYPELNDDQLESLGIVDVLFIPVGGNGYTVDAHGAVQLIKLIEPKIVIPTHYQESGVKYEVPQAELDVFLKELGVTEHTTQDSLKLKDIDLTGSARLVVLKRAIS